MTIHELLALTGLTESDEIPVWDEEASGEPTKKITAQNFAAAIKTLASLLGTGDVVNDLTINDPTKVASQAEAYALAQKSIDTSGAQYVKFADGTLIQWGDYGSSSISATAVGSLYMVTVALNITFPIPFNTAPQVSIMQYGGYGAVFTSAFSSTGISSVDLARPTSGSITPNLHWIAIGRWK